MPARSDDPLRRVTLKGECFIYCGSTNDDGYGQFWYNGRHWLAHRYSYTTSKGEIPEGVQVLHSCDNPSCVNPHHLFLGSQQNNIDDCIAKGRRYKHERKITEAQRMEIHELVAEGLSYREIGLKYGVTRQTIYKYVIGVR